MSIYVLMYDTSHFYVYLLTHTLFTSLYPPVGNRSETAVFAFEKEEHFQGNNESFCCALISIEDEEQSSAYNDSKA